MVRRGSEQLETAKPVDMQKWTDEEWIATVAG